MKQLVLIVFGYYARILVDLDLLEFSLNFLLVKREGYALIFMLSTKKNLHYVLFCHIIGHSLEHYHAKNIAKSDGGKDNKI